MHRLWKAVFEFAHRTRFNIQSFNWEMWAEQRNTQFSFCHKWLIWKEAERKKDAIKLIDKMRNEVTLIQWIESMNEWEKKKVANHSNAHFLMVFHSHDERNMKPRSSFKHFHLSFSIYYALFCEDWELRWKLSRLNWKKKNPHKGIYKSSLIFILFHCKWKQKRRMHHFQRTNTHYRIYLLVSVFASHRFKKLMVKWVNLLENVYASQLIYGYVYRMLEKVERERMIWNETVSMISISHEMCDYLISIKSSYIRDQINRINPINFETDCESIECSLLPTSTLQSPNLMPLADIFLSLAHSFASFMTFGWISA